MRTAALATVLLAAFIGQVDLFVVNVAAPSIQRALDASFQELQFVVSGYVIVYAAGLIVGGRSGDRWGHRRTFAAGVTAFATGSALCALAPSAPLLIAARALQGAAAAAMMPQVLSIVHANVPEGPQRDRAVGVYGAAIGLGVVAGLIGGGMLVGGDVAGLGWRAVFLVNLPICAVVLLGTHAFVPSSRAARPQRLDLTGAAIATCALPALLLPAAVGGTLGWPAWTLACLTSGMVLVGALVVDARRKQRRGADPIIPSRLFAHRGFALCMTLVVLFFAGNAGLFLVLTYHLQAGLGLGPLGAGLVFAPLGAGFAVSSTATRGPASRFGIRLAVPGALLMTVSLCGVPLATGAGPGAEPWLLGAVLAVSGVGQGLVVAPLIGTVLALVPPGESGIGSGVYNTFVQAGMATGVTVLGAIYRGALGANPAGTASALSHDRIDGALDTAALLLAAVAMLVGLLAVRIATITTSPR